jgi:ribonuclease E
MSRQRLQPSLGETSYNPCPRCHGTGHIRGTESSALHILRILQEEAMKENTGALHVQLPVDVATFLLNEKRLDIHTLETRLKVSVILIPNVHLETPNYSIARLRHDELNRSDAAEPSYKMAVMPEANEDETPGVAAQPAPRQEAAVKSIAPAQRQPIARPTAVVPPPGGMFDRIFGWFKKTLSDEPAEPAPAVAETRERPVRSERPQRSPTRRNDNREPREAREGKPQRETRESNEARPPREPRAERPLDSAKPARAPRPPKPPRIDKPVEPVAATIEPVAAANEPREPRNRRGRGGRGRNRDDRLQAGQSDDNGQLPGIASPAASGFGAIIESARAKPAAVPVAVANQQSLELEPHVQVAASAAPAVSNPASGLQQVETQPAAPSESNDGARERPRRRRRPATSAPVGEPVLQQVETVFAAPATAAPDQAEPVESGRTVPHPTRRRQRPQTVVVNEPLIQVETGQTPQ